MVFSMKQQIVNVFKNNVTPYSYVFKNIYCVFIFWIIVHYISSHMYIYFCTSPTSSGFVMSSFMLAAPHCQALRWLVYNGGNTIISTWITFGFWLLSYISPMTKTPIKKNIIPIMDNEYTEKDDFDYKNNFDEVIDLTYSDSDDDDETVTDDDTDDTDDDSIPSLIDIDSDDYSCDDNDETVIGHDDSIPPLIDINRDDDDDDNSDDRE